MDPALKAAVLGAGSIKAPASPLGASKAPELAQLYQSSFQLPQSAGAVNAAANIAQISQQPEQDLADIKAYKIIKKADGGYDFFDPKGEQVDIATVSQRTGTKPSELVKDSENPIDIQYRNDQTNLQDYVNAVLSADKKKVAAYWKADPALKQYKDKGGTDRLIKQFHQAYERYYIPRTVNPQAWGTPVPGSPLVPTAQYGNGIPGAPSLSGGGIGQIPGA